MYSFCISFMPWRFILWMFANKALGCSGLLKQIKVVKANGGTRHFLYQLHRPSGAPVAKAEGSNTLGKLEIMWRTTLGEPGRLQTQQILGNVSLWTDFSRNYPNWKVLLKSAGIDAASLVFIVCRRFCGTSKIEQVQCWYVHLYKYAANSTKGSEFADSGATLSNSPGETLLGTSSPTLLLEFSACFPYLTNRSKRGAVAGGMLKVASAFAGIFIG